MPEIVKVDIETGPLPRAEALLEALPRAIVVLDADGGILFANREALRRYPEAAGERFDLARRGVTPAFLETLSRGAGGWRVLEDASVPGDRLVVASVVDPVARLVVLCEPASDAAPAPRAALGEVVAAAARLVAAAERWTDPAEAVEDVARAIQKLAEEARHASLTGLIEAARAGDSGRGFAVVADEMQRLSESLRKSADELEFILREARHDAEAAVAEFEGAKGALAAALAEK